MRHPPPRNRCFQGRSILVLLFQGALPPATILCPCRSQVGAAKELPLRGSSLTRALTPGVQRKIWDTISPKVMAMWEASRQRFQASRARRAKKLPNCGMRLLVRIAGG